MTAAPSTPRRACGDHSMGDGSAAAPYQGVFIDARLHAYNDRTGDPARGSPVLRDDRYIIRIFEDAETGIIVC